MVGANENVANTVVIETSQTSATSQFPFASARYLILFIEN
jgi:hypothetical protein